MHKLGGNIEFQLLDFDGLVDDELKEKLVNSLKMGPCWVHLLLLVNTCLSKIELLFVNTGEWAENVLFNHLHSLVHIVNYHADNNLLVGQHHLQLVNCVQSLGLAYGKLND